LAVSPVAADPLAVRFVFQSPHLFAPMARPAKPVRDYTSRRGQWRLLLLVVPLGLVMLMMARLRDPETADRINKMFAPAATAPPPAEDAVVAAQGVPGVRRELLESIQDNTYFRNTEKRAWFHFLKIAQQETAPELDSAHASEVTYTQLVDQPDAYRGKLVTVTGEVRQITEQKPAENKLGLENYYRLVIEPADGVDWPIFVYCLELPASLQTGDGMHEAVHGTGLFFKNLSYSWQGGLGTAPVIVATRLEHIGVGVSRAADIDRRWNKAAEAVSDEPPHEPARNELQSADPTNRGSAFFEILALAGWNAERLRQLDDSQRFSNQHRRQALDLLRRLCSFDSASLAAWKEVGVTPQNVLDKPADHRGKLVQLRGRVTEVTPHALSSANSARLEMQAYYECRLAFADGDRTATVLTGRVPDDWLKMRQLNEPATAVALFLKRPADNQPNSGVWLAKEIAWHPTTANEPFVSLGESVLGALGLDVGLFDGVASRGPIRAAEREAFYQTLNAAGRLDAQHLVGLAQRELPIIAESWTHELRSAKTESRRRLARAVVDRAADGRYSVAPLFNEPESQTGRLIFVDGAARRVVRVEVGARSHEGGVSDVRRRFGIGHYYEMEVFTDDSQNYPLVFCLHELPEGFPTGGSIHVPVRVAGFFFKDWLYQKRGAAPANSAEATQYAPLLIGRAPLLLAVEQGGGRVIHFALGGFFVAAMAAIWAAAVWFSWGDRRFRERTPAARFSLPAGSSLNELNISPAEQPMEE
jgi:hypothetical protein